MTFLVCITQHNCLCFPLLSLFPRCYFACSSPSCSHLFSYLTTQLPFSFSSSPSIVHIKMGNCLALCDSSSGTVLAKQGRIVRVAKPDGKILDFGTPISVKQILENFPALSICVSKDASEPLSPDYELKAGRLYYLLPNLSSLTNTEAGSGIKRVKIVITKQQLEQLVAKQISLEDVLSDVQSRTGDLPSNWKPQLDSIPEGNE